MVAAFGRGDAGVMISFWAIVAGTVVFNLLLGAGIAAMISTAADHVACDLEQSR